MDLTGASAVITGGASGVGDAGAGVGPTGIAFSRTVRQGPREPRRSRGAGGPPPE